MKYNLPAEMQWENYFLRKGDLARKFWENYLHDSNKKILFILGLGFDPRMLDALKIILSVISSGKIYCILIKFKEGNESYSKEYRELIIENFENFNQLIPNDDDKETVEIDMWSDDGRPIGSKQAANAIDEVNFELYDEIIVDISALPRGIFFPIIGKLLATLERNSLPNLHVVVSENAILDKKILDAGIDESASYMAKFTGGLGDTSKSQLPKIWIPLMGEKQLLQLKKIHELVKPDEIHPLFPMPSTDSRKFEGLLEEYGNWIFDTIRIDPRNLIYAAEQNPFEVYREIRKTVQHYIQTFDVGGCQIAISPLSNKLSSLGSLLAAYELKELGIGIAQIETKGYKFDDISSMSKISKSELFTLWISGECYGS